jgi:hypothetical protein
MTRIPPSLKPTENRIRQIYIDNTSIHCIIVMKGKDMPTLPRTRIRVADEVWIATALLHRENPEQLDFSIDEIVEEAAKLRIAGSIRPGVYVHVIQHCVANRPPNPARCRMLFEAQPGRRRLFRKGDAYDPAREGSKMTPNPDEIPIEYVDLLSWYRDWSSAATKASSATDPLLALAGSGKALWADEHADEYIRRLREGWE